jgi:ABC-type uncharacterized transport system involved in gliding motility auxiliary subunit
MNPTLRTALAVVCVLVITFCAIFVVAEVTDRGRIADLTEQDLYTLSQGTKNILGKLNQPITLKLYYSRTAARKGPEQIRYWNNYYLYVRDLLEEYAARSDGKLRLQIIDPRPFSDEEEEAIRYGIRRFQLSEDEAFFFGLAAVTELGKDEVIEFFEPDRQEFVEYDVSKTIASLMQREKRKVGIIADVPIMGTDMSPYMMQMMRMQGRQPEPPWTIVERLRENYEVTQVKLEEGEHAIPEDIDYLMVVHPKDLDERTRFAIDQFVMKGGKLLVFTDPHCLADTPQMPMRNRMQAMQHDASSNLNDLLETWGVEMESGSVAVDRTLAVTTQMDRSRPPVKFPAYLNLNEACVNKDVVVTANLHSLRMLFPGVLKKKDAGTEVQPLLETSSVGNTWTPDSPFELRMPDPEKIRREISDGTEPVMLAAMITGKLKTNFPDGIEVKVEQESSEQEPAEKAGAALPKAPKPKLKIGGPKGEPGDKGDKGPKAKPKAKAPAKTEAKAPAPKPKAKAKPKAPTPKAKAPEPKAKATAKEAPKEEKAEEAKEEPKTRRVEARKEAAEGAVVLVVADVDMLTDMLAYQRTFFGQAQAGDNAPFLVNALDYLSGTEDLIHIRTRGQYSRPFTVVEEIEQRAEKATAAEIQAIKDKISKYEKELQQLAGTATEKNIELLQSDALRKRRNIEAEIRKANRQLRKLQAARREEVEELGSSLQWWNMIAAPSIILLIAIALAIFRWVRAKHYAARRAE